MRLHNLLQVGNQPQPPGSIGLLTHPTLNLQLMMCLHNKWAHQLIHIDFIDLAFVLLLDFGPYPQAILPVRLHGHLYYGTDSRLWSRQQSLTKCLSLHPSIASSDEYNTIGFTVPSM